MGSTLRNTIHCFIILMTLFRSSFETNSEPEDLDDKLENIRFEVASVDTDLDDKLENIRFEVASVDTNYMSLHTKSLHLNKILTILEKEVRENDSIQINIGDIYGTIKNCQEFVTENEQKIEDAKKCIKEVETTEMKFTEEKKDLEDLRKKIGRKKDELDEIKKRVDRNVAIINSRRDYPK